MDIKMTVFPADRQEGRLDNFFTAKEANDILAFHKTLKDYTVTPLRSLDALAQATGVRNIFVKDESYRFGLNAFKGLGGSYALAKVLAEKTGTPIEDLSSVPENTYTFVTATDGNHGRGVAWAAKNLHQKAVVYMPKGSAQERLDNIRAQGADAEITDLIYDDTVRFAAKQAEKHGWIQVQDTSWDGYEEIPLQIMQGYMTMAMEALDQLNGVRPTHIFLQSGVGSMAGAITGIFRDLYPEDPPTFLYVEPHQADCLYRTAEADDGTLHTAEGDLHSIMAGLSCGEVCPLAWDIIKHHGEYFFSVPDYIAADGMRVLGNPLSTDPKIISGESGASTFGLVYNLLTDPALKEYKETVGLNADSVILCISTEGDTDRENYRRIVRDGLYSKDS